MSVAAKIPVRTFDELLRGVQETFVAGKRRIEDAIVFANWETGRQINEHLLLNAGRAGYAEGVIPRLEKHSGIHARLLYQCAQFHRRFPILHRGSKLGWTHYRLLCQVEDEQQRKRLAAQAQRQAWTAPELETRVRQLNLMAATREAATNDGEVHATASAPAKLLTARQGTPGLYPVVARAGGTFALDLGFKMFLRLDAAETRRLKLAAGDIVSVGDDGELARDGNATKADLFTYGARDVRVVDGDTLAVTIALPPHNEIDKKLRLRGLNCPEFGTDAGKAAKRFVQQLVDAAGSVVLTTTKPDKYDRYLADVFLLPDPTGQIAEPLFLNNALLENGHAVRYDGTTPPDWDT